MKHSQSELERRINAESFKQWQEQGECAVELHHIFNPFTSRIWAIAVLRQRCWRHRFDMRNTALAEKERSGSHNPETIIEFYERLFK